ncbi:MAG: hypothetical protein PHQ00_05480, partial [Phycisphaerae bacterium]|nr:hypothetical protein [Phycisphaerae bacterium]
HMLGVSFGSGSPACRQAGSSERKGATAPSLPLTPDARGSAHSVRRSIAARYTKSKANHPPRSLMESVKTYFKIEKCFDLRI